MLTTKFHVGDRVIYTGTYSQILIGKIGTIIEFQGIRNCKVKWDDDKNGLLDMFSPEHKNLTLYTNSSDEMLRLLLNKKITNEYFKEMS